jgi:hypothetical protein
MTLETLTQLEEMEKSLGKGAWEINEDSQDGEAEVCCHWHTVGPMELAGKKGNELEISLCAIRNNVPELLAMARWAIEKGYNDQKDV